MAQTAPAPPDARASRGSGSWASPGYGSGGSPSGGAADPRGQGALVTRRRRARSDPGGLVAGLVIAGIGLFFLATQLEPDIGRFVVLFIGLALLAVFVVRREYGFLVPGSILTGVGIGVALSPAVSGVAQSGVMMLSIAGGFLGIWLLGALYRVRPNHWWPLIPGGILTLIGLVQLSRADMESSLRFWPIVLIIAGLVVLARTLTRRA